MRDDILRAKQKVLTSRWNGVMTSQRLQWMVIDFLMESCGYEWSLTLRRAVREECKTW